VICIVVVFIENVPIAFPVQDANIGIEFAGMVTVKVPVFPVMTPASVIWAAPIIPVPEKPIVPMIELPFWVICHVMVPSDPIPTVPPVGMPMTEPVEVLNESPAVPTQVPAAGPGLPDPD
jgi:hypothetical protein